IGAILGGVAGAYKYKLYSELDDCILILDDLERVSDNKLIKNILGECLNLAESKNIKVIVVANEDKLTCKDDLEKVFSDKYKFSFTHEEVVSILKDEYTILDDKLCNEILLNITAINSKNIRVLKRAISKFVRIYHDITKIEDIILDQALAKVLSHMIRICYAKFECGFSKEIIIESIESRIVRSMDKSTESDIDNNYKKLDSIFDDSFYNINEKLLTYCCDGIFEFENLDEELSLPIKRKPLDAMKSIWSQNQLSDDEFVDGVILLEDFISNAINIDIYEWFTICDVYIYMLENKIIASDNYTTDELLTMCDDIDVKRFNIPVYEDDYYHEHRSNFYSKEVTDKFISKRSELSEVKAEVVNSKFSIDFQESWLKVQNEVNKNLMHKPIFQDINIEIIETAFRSWTNEDLFQFARFIKHRYRFNNIQDLFSSEIEALKSISSMIARLNAEFIIGLKVASLSELQDSFTDAYTRMESNLLKHEKSESAI
ncbi:NTPase, partial [Aliivibrio sp. S4TY2]|uniref:NTPase n=1 Tax=unclassified Aliivibrio TaxID=2645654 RepID=UPI0023799C19